MAKSSNAAQVSVAACVLLVALRMAIGWQFLYEGMWKLDTQKTPTPWSADGYLANSQGPFRETFRNLASDPDGLKKLDYATVTATWDKFRDRFVHHYRTKTSAADKLTDAQVSQIFDLTDGPLASGPMQFTQPLAALPDGVDLSKFRFRRPSPGKDAKGNDPKVQYDAAQKQLTVNVHLLEEEGDDLASLAPKNAAWKAACRALAAKAGKLSFKERLRILLVEDRDRNGLIQKQYEGSADYHRPGDVDLYKHLVERHRKELAAARVKYEHDHLQRNWADLQERKGKLIGPVDALTTEMQTALYNTLTYQQLRSGATPPAPQPWVNQSVIWGLIALGALMFVGLFSRLSSLGGAVLLLSFYLAMPPFPGVPEAPGPEHSLIVNKNLIECLACLALAFIPSGRWFGIDALIHRLLNWNKKV